MPDTIARQANQDDTGFCKRSSASKLALLSQSPSALLLRVGGKAVAWAKDARGGWDLSLAFSCLFLRSFFDFLLYHALPTPSDV